MPNISKQIIREIIETLDVCGVGAHHPDLLPLLAQPEQTVANTILLCFTELMRGLELNSPVMSMRPDACFHIGRAIAGQAKRAPDATPAPFTPISADDVTDEMVLAWYKDFPYMANMPHAIQSAKKDLTAAYNVVNALAAKK